MLPRPAAGAKVFIQGRRFEDKARASAERFWGCVRYDFFIPWQNMPKRAIKKTISLPEDLFRELQRQAEAEQKTLSGVIQEELQAARRARLKQEFQEIQSYWSRKAEERGILSQRDLERYLRK